MKKYFIPYELAKLLKEKGFKEPCLTYWWTTKEDKTPQLRLRELDINGFINHKEGNTTAPMYHQVIEWLREKHDVHVAASSFTIYNGIYGHQYVRGSKLSGGWSTHVDSKTYHDALERAIREALEFIK